VMEGYKLLQRVLALAGELREQIDSTGVFHALTLGELLPDEVKGDGIRLDPTKITVDISACGLTVDELRDELFNRFNITVEKSTFNTITLLLTIGTTRSKCSRLYDALRRIAHERHAPRRPYRAPVLPPTTAPASWSACSTTTSRSTARCPGASAPTRSSPTRPASRCSSPAS